MKKGPFKPLAPLILLFLVLTSVKADQPVVDCVSTFSTECLNEYRPLDFNLDFVLYSENSSLTIEDVNGEEATLNARDLNSLAAAVDSYNTVNSKHTTDDKVLHTHAGRLTSIVAQSMCSEMGIEPTGISRKTSSFLCGLGASTLASILKEVYDSTGRGEVDSMDAVATSFGGVWLEFRF